MQNIARHTKKKEKEKLSIFSLKNKKILILSGNGFINDMLFNIPFVEKLYDV